jgi:hypothetical protein
MSGRWLEGLVFERKASTGPLLLNEIVSRHRKLYTEGSLDYKLRTRVKRGNCNPDLSANKLKDIF